MKTHIVTEGVLEMQLLDKLLQAAGAENYRISAAGAKSSVISFARSILSSRQSPVALVMDADTVDADKIKEQEWIYYDLLRTASRKAPFQVFLAVPEIEILFFSDPQALGDFLGTPISSDTLRGAEFRPKEALEDLLRRTRADERRAWLIEKLDERTAGRLARHPLIQNLATFVAQPTRWSPESDGEGTQPRERSPRGLKRTTGGAAA
jgi:hypothetical protein